MDILHFDWNKSTLQSFIIRLRLVNGHGFNLFVHEKNHHKDLKSHACLTIITLLFKRKKEKNERLGVTFMAYVCTIFSCINEIVFKTSDWGNQKINLASFEVL